MTIVKKINFFRVCMCVCVGGGGDITNFTLDQRNIRKSFEMQCGFRQNKTTKWIFLGVAKSHIINCVFTPCCLETENV